MTNRLTGSFLTLPYLGGFFHFPNRKYISHSGLIFKKRLLHSPLKCWDGCPNLETNLKLRIMPNMKETLWTVVAVLVGLALYDMVVRKALKISAYDEYENFEDYEGE